MKVWEVIEELKKFDRNALVMINRESVHGVAEERGRLAEAYGTQVLKYVIPSKARDAVVTFAHYSENSLGEQVLSTLWLDTNRPYDDKGREKWHESLE